MKKTQLIELFHTAAKTWVSFLSIVMFVALGVGIFLGLTWSGQAVEEGAKADFDAYAFHHFDISYPYGITDKDLADIAAIDGVEKVEGGYSASATFASNGAVHVAKVLSSTSDVDRMRVLEGEVPTAPNEVAMDSAFAMRNNVKVGDTLRLDTVSTNPITGAPLLKGTDFTITAIVAHPAFVLSSSSMRGMTDLPAGEADSFLVVPQSAFDREAYGDCYSNAYVLLEPGPSYGISANSQEATAVFDRLVALGEVNASARYQEIYNEAKAKIDDGEAKIQDGEKQLADAAAKIQSGEKQLAEGKRQIADAEKQLAAGRAQLADALRQLEEGQVAADAADAEVNAKLNEAAALLQSIGMEGDTAQIAEELRAQLDSAVASGMSAVDLLKSMGLSDEMAQAGASEVEPMLAQYREYKSKKAQLASGWNQYYAGKSTLEKKAAELEAGKNLLAKKGVELEQGKVRYEEGKAQLENAKAELESAKASLAKLTERDWMVSGRDSNLSLMGLETYRDSTDRLRWSMALVFVIVGLLVCYTAVSRIVREDIVSIGTKKALGLRSGEITRFYLLYSAIAVIIGGALSVAVSVVVECVIAWKILPQFTFTQLPVYVSAVDLAVMGGVELAFIELATWLACKGLLKKQAVQLLRGIEPPKNRQRFYEKTRLWNRMPLFSQSIVNDFFNDKIRVVGTIIGVAGSTALVVIALMLYFNVNNSFERQFEDVYIYDARISYSQNTAGAEESVTQVLEAQGIQSTPVMRRTYGIVNEDGSLNAGVVVVPEDVEAFASLYRVNDIGGGQGSFDVDGAWVTQAYSEHKNAKVGDTIRLMDSSGTVRDVPIAGIFEFWINTYEVLLPSDVYQSEFGVAPRSNTILAKVGDADKDKLKAQLSQVDGFFSLTNEYAKNRVVFQTYQSLTQTVVFVYLALAVVMSFIVILNLVTMFIDEKKREIIVLRINGFSVHAAKAYVYRSNIVLTAIGIVLGVGLGILMGYLSLVSIEIGASRYIHDPNLVACLAGVMVSVVLAVVINLIALRRIPRFDLTDINRL